MVISLNFFFRKRIFQNQQQKKYQDVIQKLIRRYIQGKYGEHQLKTTVF